MDRQVQLAMAKWPNVPHCYGWLALDARGAWRMRDQRTQELGLPGSKITNPILRGFIDRNYGADERGCYFFQNGPQRVYVELQATPYIAHSDPTLGWVLHTGVVMDSCDRVWMTQEGNLILQNASCLAQVDDRDMAGVLSDLRLNGVPVSDEQLLHWMNHPDDRMSLLNRNRFVPVRMKNLDALSQTHPYVSSPFHMQQSG